MSGIGLIKREKLQSFGLFQIARVSSHYGLAQIVGKCFLSFSKPL